MSETIRICLGSEPIQNIPCQVLKSSILRRTTRPVEFYESWTPKHGWHELCGKYHRSSGTLFSHWRWIVPELLGRSGKAIYQDSDQACFGDIGELYDTLDDKHVIAAVIGAEGFFGDKPAGADTVETSLMVMDLAKCPWEPGILMNDVKEGKMQYGKMMQARWMDRELIQSLPKPWNHFNIHIPGITKVTHWTKVREQPYRNPKHKTAVIFEKELKDSIAVGHIDPGVLRKEVKLGNMDKHYLGVIK